jgi:hypothetical protein
LWQQPIAKRRNGKAVTSIVGKQAIDSTVTPMCSDCRELDRKIDHYRKLATLVTDKRAQDALATLITMYERERDSLHPQPRGVRDSQWALYAQ